MIRNSRFVFFVCFFAFCVLSFTIPVYAQPVSSSELINNTKQYDSCQIIYEGEAIGDIMLRNDHVWVNVSDGANTIGVWCEKALAGKIVYTGSYKTKGDILRIEGIFHGSCLDHGGDLDIHAMNISRIKEGCEIERKLSDTKRNSTLILLGALCLIILIQLKKK